MGVIIGSARISENGTNGWDGKALAGDQRQKDEREDFSGEVSMQSYYNYSGGWYCLRCKDVLKRERIAQAMKEACINKCIGYDQSQRLTLLDAARVVNFNIKSIKRDVETDCSALVRVCLLAAGCKDPGNFRTADEVDRIKSTGEFDLITSVKENMLETGDILVSKKTPGHTVIVVRGSSFAINTLKKVETVRRGSKGRSVEILQSILGGLDIDGEFGPNTEKRVIEYQRIAVEGLVVDGIVGNNTWHSLIKTLL